MPVLADDYLNSVCEVRTSDGVVLMKAYLNKILEEQFQIVRSSSKRLPLLDGDKQVEIEVLNNVYGSLVFVGKVSGSTENYLKVDNIVNKADLKKRQFFRVNTVFPARGYMGENALEKVENLEYNSNSTKDLTHLKIDVDNLSINGLHIVVKTKREPLKPGDQMVIAVTLGDHKVNLPITVRRETTNRQGEPNGYGCSFDVSEGPQIEAVGNYLAECQRKQIQKARTGTAENEEKNTDG